MKILLYLLFFTFIGFGKSKLPATNTIVADIDGVTTVFAVSAKASRAANGGALHSIEVTACKNYTQPFVTLTITINSDWPVDKQTYSFNRANKSSSAGITYAGDNDPAPFEPDDTQFNPVTVTITSIDNYNVQGNFSGWLSSRYGKVRVTNGYFTVNF